MSTAAVLLVLVAAGAHAGWNRIVHDTGDRLAVMAVSGIVAAVLLGWDAALHPPSAVWPSVVLSGAAEAIYVFLLTAAYARGSLAVAYPVGRGTAPLLVTFFVWGLAGERPAPIALLGACLLAAGLLVVAGVGRAGGQHTAIALAMATGVAIAVYSAIDAVAVRHTSPAGYLACVMAVEGVLVALIGRVGARRLVAAARPGALVGIGTVAAYLLVLLAYRRAPAGRVATLREVSVVIAVALSADRGRRSLWLGAALVALGAIAAAG